MNDIVLSVVRTILPERMRISLKRIFGTSPFVSRVRIMRTHKAMTRILGPQYRPNRDKIELDITWECTLRCRNCGRRCDLAPTRESMTLGQVNKFIMETIAQRRRWKIIYVIGGEPTLHKEILAIVAALLEYKERYSPDTEVAMVSNGLGPSCNEVLRKLEACKGLRIINTSKASSRQLFKAVNYAPADMEEYKNSDYANSCWLRHKCGMGLTCYGYYPCQAGGAIDRIFGLDIGRNSLPSRDEKWTKEYRILCRLCGHFRRDGKLTYDEEISPTWRKALEQYRQKKPQLKLY